MHGDQRYARVSARQRQGLFAGRDPTAFGMSVWTLLFVRPFGLCCLYRPRSLAVTVHSFKAKRTNTLRAIHTPPSILYGAHAREGGTTTTNKRKRKHPETNTSLEIEQN